MKSPRRSIAAGFACFILCGGATWLTIRYAYWPSVTRPSTVSAAEAGDLELLQALHQKGMSLDYHDTRKFMWTPLMAAAYAGHSNIVAYLLKQGVSIEAHDAQGRTALLWAIDGADSDVSIVRMLLDSGAKTNATIMSTASLSPQRDRLLRMLSRGR